MSSVSADMEEVLADLSGQIGQQAAMIAMRDSALRKANAKIAELEAEIDKLTPKDTPPDDEPDELTKHRRPRQRPQVDTRD